MIEEEGPSREDIGPIGLREVTTCEEEGTVGSHDGPVIEDEGPFGREGVTFGAHEGPSGDLAVVACGLTGVSVFPDGVTTGTFAVVGILAGSTSTVGVDVDVVGDGDAWPCRQASADGTGTRKPHRSTMELP